MHTRTLINYSMDKETPAAQRRRWQAHDEEIAAATARDTLGDDGLAAEMLQLWC